MVPSDQRNPLNPRKPYFVGGGGCANVSTVPDNREIYQCAKLIIDRFGDDGAIDHCDGRILEFENDPDAATVWKGIRVAVKHLLGGAPGPDEVVN